MSCVWRYLLFEYGINDIRNTPLKTINRDRLVRSEMSEIEAVIYRDGVLELMQQKIAFDTSSRYIL